MGGANVYNKDTFGDDADFGWSFEENLAANERIAIARLPTPPPPPLPPPPQVPPGNFTVDSPSSTPSIKASTPSTKADTPNTRKSRIVPADPKMEIEEEIQAVVTASATLRRADFDGSVRQYLHAIRTKGGRDAVHEAGQVILDATV